MVNTCAQRSTRWAADDCKPSSLSLKVAECACEDISIATKATKDPTQGDKYLADITTMYHWPHSFRAIWQTHSSTADVTDSSPFDAESSIGRVKPAMTCIKLLSGSLENASYNTSGAYKL